MFDSDESDYVFENDRDSQAETEEKLEALKSDSEPEQPVTGPGTEVASNNPR